RDAVIRSDACAMTPCTLIPSFLKPGNWIPVRSIAQAPAPVARARATIKARTRPAKMLSGGPMNAIQRLAARVSSVLDRVLVGQAAKFALIGVVNTCVDFGVFLLALTFLTSSLVAANVLSWTVAVTGSYMMNSFVTFAAESGRRLRWRDYIGFIGSGIAG